MSHNARIRTPGGWTLSSTVDPAEFEAFDAAQAAAINGDDGGVWAPASILQIGGAGVKFTTDVRLDSTAELTCTSGAKVTGALKLDSGAVLEAKSGTTIKIDTGAHLNMNGGDVTGDWTATGNVTVDGALVGHDALTIDGLTTAGSLLVGTTSTFVGAATFDAAIKLASDGRITYRAAAGADADTTYDVTAANVIVVTVSADRTYTIDDTGAANGDVFEFVNLSATHFLQIVRPGGGNVVGLKSATGLYWSARVMRIGGVWTLIDATIGT